MGGTRLPLPVNRHDTGDPQRLYEYLSSLERSVRELAQQNEQLAAALQTKTGGPPALAPAQLAQVQTELSADGRYPLPLTGLTGDTGSGQNPKFASGTSLPDPITAIYDSFVVTGGTYDLLYRLNRDVNPNAWVQIATYPVGSLMTLDTTQTVVSTGVKTVQASWVFQVDQFITAAKNGTLLFRVNNTDAVGTSAQATLRVLADTAQASLHAYGTARTLTRCGITLAAWTELLASNSAAGLLVDVSGNFPLVFGTNDVERARFTGAGGATGWTLTVGQLMQMVGAVAANTTMLEILKSVADGGASVFKVDYEGDVTANDVTLRDLIQNNTSVAMNTTGTSVDVDGLDASTATAIFRVLFGGASKLSVDGTGRIGHNGDLVTGGNANVLGNTDLDGTLNVDGTTRLRSAVTIDISFNVGSGTTITKIVAYSPTLSPVAVAANTTEEQTFTVTGLTTSDRVTLPNKPTAQAGLGIVGARVSAADTLAITFSNNTAGSITPTASEVYKFLAFRS